jgi:hypothetical protein
MPVLMLPAVTFMLMLPAVTFMLAKDQRSPPC